MTSWPRSSSMAAVLTRISASSSTCENDKRRRFGRDRRLCPQPRRRRHRPPGSTATPWCPRALAAFELQPPLRRGASGVQRGDRRAAGELQSRHPWLVPEPGRPRPAIGTRRQEPGQDLRRAGRGRPGAVPRPVSQHDDQHQSGSPTCRSTCGGRTDRTDAPASRSSTSRRA